MNSGPALLKSQATVADEGDLQGFPHEHQPQDARRDAQPIQREETIGHNLVLTANFKHQVFLVTDFRRVSAHVSWFLKIAQSAS